MSDAVTVELVDGRLDLHADVERSAAAIETFAGAGEAAAYRRMLDWTLDHRLLTLSCLLALSWHNGQPDGLLHILPGGVLRKNGANTDFKTSLCGPPPTVTEMIQENIIKTSKQGGHISVLVAHGYELAT